uniref:Putative ovule protein n=1 Tax=Solanum chacoense TaxID=4108 RepID=A0A0V0HPC4_SOLCH
MNAAPYINIPLVEIIVGLFDKPATTYSRETLQLYIKYYCCTQYFHEAGITSVYFVIFSTV